MRVEEMRTKLVGLAPWQYCLDPVRFRVAGEDATGPVWKGRKVAVGGKPALVIRSGLPATVRGSKCGAT